MLNKSLPRLVSFLILLTPQFVSAEAGDAPDVQLRWSGPARQGDEVWVINTREMKQPVQNASEFQVELFDNDNGWCNAHLIEFLETADAQVVTLFYLHGYGYDSVAAREYGWAVYNALVGSLESDRRFRFVIWSWPSTAIKFKPIRDVRDKSRRTNAEAYYLAWVLARMRDDIRATIVGYSLGARIATGALHLSNSSSPAFIPEGRATASRPAVRAALVAAALRNNWLEQGEFHGRASSRVDRLLVLSNELDPTLLNFGSLSKHGNAVALGAYGVRSLEKIGEGASRIQQLDVSASVGENHSITDYLRAEEVISNLRPFVFWNRTSGESVATAKNR
jgi:pimeloyl-ACP methyl ester carboxylesterase